MVEALPPYEYADLTVADPSYPAKTIDTENASASYSLGATAQGRNPTIASVYGDPKIGEQYLPLARQRSEIAHRLNVNDLEIFSSSLTVPGGDKIVFNRNFSSDKVGIYTLSQNKPGKDYVLNFDASVLDTSKAILSLPEKNFNLRSQFQYGGYWVSIPSVGYSPSGLPVASCSKDASLRGPDVIKYNNLKSTIIFTGRLVDINAETYNSSQLYSWVGGLYQNCYLYVYNSGDRISIGTNTYYNENPMDSNSFPFSMAVATEVADVVDRGTLQDSEYFNYADITFKESVYLNGNKLYSGMKVRENTWVRSDLEDDHLGNYFSATVRDGSSAEMCQIVTHDKILEPDVIADISNRHLSKWGF